MHKVSNLLDRYRRRRPNTSFPTIGKSLGSGTNGVTFLTTNTPPKVMKVTLGSATREIGALQRLKAAGANFVPSVNFVNIRKNMNKNIKNALFPINHMGLSPEARAENIERRRTLSMYTMNKVGNVNLYRYVKSRPGLSNANKRQIRSEILRAIKFMHAHGISHGDLHAGNILVELSPDGHMKKLWVIDFGRYVNIPVGQAEKAAYTKFNRNFNNYNLFNYAAGPVTQLWTGPTGPARKNLNLYRLMYGGKNNNVVTAPKRTPLQKLKSFFVRR